MRSTFASCILHVMTLCALLLSPLIAHGQQCTRRAVIQSDADVYQSPPRYVTGAGWQGERTDVLTTGTQVFQCGDRNVAFGFSTKAWSQVAYRRGTVWRYGWILQEALRFVSHDRKQFGMTSAIIPVVYQVAADVNVTQDGKWALGDAAPPPPTSTETMKTTTEASVNAPTLSEQLALYWPLFGAMLFGMVAKAAVDLIEEWDQALVMRQVRNGMVAILVSPIVFLGFLNAGKFDSSEQTFLVLLMLSFQNGFFWQTILKGGLRAAPTKDRPKQGKTSNESEGGN